MTPRLILSLLWRVPLGMLRDARDIRRALNELSKGLDNAPRDWSAE